MDNMKELNEMEEVIYDLKDAITETVEAMDSVNTVIYVLRDGTIKIHYGSNNLCYDLMDAKFVAEISHDNFDYDDEDGFDAEYFSDCIINGIDWDDIESATRSEDFLESISE